jgi:hypothetical protein
MTAQERATQFVRRYPLLFTEDKEFWIVTIARMILEAEIEQAKKDKEMALRILRKGEA